jgi:hypothetical protein
VVVIGSVFEVENIIGTSVNDSLSGNSDTNEFVLGGSCDTVDSFGSLDTVSYVGASSAVAVDLSISGTGQSVSGGQGSTTCSTSKVVVQILTHYDFGSSGGDSIVVVATGTTC